MENYFSNHYSKMQGIDSSSEQSINAWYKDVLSAYDAELKPYAKEFINKSILEIGCGIGGLLNYFKSLEHDNYYGIDQSSEQLNVCRKFVTEEVEVIEASKFFEKNEKQYDMIIMFDLIEHIKKEKIIPLLKQIYNSLNVGGKLLIRTPNMSSFFSNNARYVDFTHEIGFTEQSINQVLVESGFKNIMCANNAIGKKRIILLEIIHWLFSKLLMINNSKIVTVNILALAEKK